MNRIDLLRALEELEANSLLDLIESALEGHPDFESGRVATWLPGESWRRDSDAYTADGEPGVTRRWVAFVIEDL